MFETESNDFTKERIAKALGRIATRGNRKVVELMLTAIEAEDYIVALPCVQAIGDVAKFDDAKVIAVLIQCLQHEEVAIRLSGLKAVSKVARRGHDRVVPMVLNALNDKNPAVRLEGIYALGQLGSPTDRNVVKSLGKIADSEHVAQRDAAKAALLKIIRSVENEELFE
eukprot:764151-Hanusia_phi.AAC.14